MSAPAPAANPVDAFAAPAQTVKVEHTYTATHAIVTDGKTTMWGCKRDSDSASFVAKQTGTGDTLKIRYIAAGTVARYLQLLAALPAPTK